MISHNLPANSIHRTWSFQFKLSLIQHHPEVTLSPLSPNFFNAQAKETIITGIPHPHPWNKGISFLAKSAFFQQMVMYKYNAIETVQKNEAKTESVPRTLWTVQAASVSRPQIHELDNAIIVATDVKKSAIEM